MPTFDSWYTSYIHLGNFCPCFLVALSVLGYNTMSFSNNVLYFWTFVVSISKSYYVYSSKLLRGQRSLVGCSPWGREELDTTERLHFHFLFTHIGEGNGNPLQCSHLGNPRDGGAWWAAVYGVTQGQTRLKRLSSSSSSILSLTNVCCPQVSGGRFECLSLAPVSMLQSALSLQHLKDNSHSR